MWCYISGEAAGEIWSWSLLEVKGLMFYESLRSFHFGHLWRAAACAVCCLFGVSSTHWLWNVCTDGRKLNQRRTFRLRLVFVLLCRSAEEILGQLKEQLFGRRQQLQEVSEQLARIQQAVQNQVRKASHPFISVQASQLSGRNFVGLQCRPIPLLSGPVSRMNLIINKP